MTRYSSADVAFLLVGGMDVLGDSTDLEDTREAILESTLVLGADWDTHEAVGVKRYTLSQQGFYNDAANRSNAALVSPGASKVLCFAPEGGAAGKPLVASPLVQATYVRQISRGALHKANATYQSEAGHDEGVILHALEAETADGNSEADAVDGGAGTTDGAVLYLQVTALDLDGYDDVSINVLHSTDNNTFTLLGSFADVAAIGAQRVVVAGAVNRYLAVEWEFNGSGSTPSITFMAGAARL